MKLDNVIYANYIVDGKKSRLVYEFIYTDTEQAFLDKGEKLTFTRAIHEIAKKPDDEGGVFLVEGYNGSEMGTYEYPRILSGETVLKNVVIIWNTTYSLVLGKESYSDDNIVTVFEANLKDSKTKYTKIIFTQGVSLDFVQKNMGAIRKISEIYSFVDKIYKESKESTLSDERFPYISSKPILNGTKKGKFKFHLYTILNERLLIEIEGNPAIKKLRVLIDALELMATINNTKYNSKVKLSYSESPTGIFIYANNLALLGFTLNDIHGEKLEDVTHLELIITTFTRTFTDSNDIISNFYYDLVTTIGYLKDIAENSFKDNKLLEFRRIVRM
jgi:hypothetical protein